MLLKDIILKEPKHDDKEGKGGKKEREKSHRHSAIVTFIIVSNCMLLVTHTKESYDLYIFFEK